MTTLKLLRPGACAAALGISTTTLWRLTRAEADFPKPYRISANAIGFNEAEILAWLAGRRTEAPAAGADHG